MGFKEHKHNVDLCFDQDRSLKDGSSQRFIRLEAAFAPGESLFILEPGDAAEIFHTSFFSLLCFKKLLWRTVGSPARHLHCFKTRDSSRLKVWRKATLQHSSMWLVSAEHIWGTDRLETWLRHFPHHQPTSAVTSSNRARQFLKNIQRAHVWSCLAIQI